MKKLGLAITLVLLTVFTYTQDLYAHARSYVWTEEYHTLPKGGREVEVWTTLEVPDGSQTNVNAWKYQGELEYGVTDHWTLAHYERLKTENQIGEDDATNYEGFKFESKYRIGEKGTYWVDPLVYVEWATDFREEEHPNEIETKIVLSKSFGKLNVTYNQIFEFELGENGRMTPEFRAAASYEILPDVQAGVEFSGEYWHPSSHRNELSVGPTIAYEHKYFWVAAGTLFSVNHAADDHEARVIVGVPF